MGYESKLIIIDKSKVRSVDNEKMVWGEEIASFYLSKVPNISKKVRKYPYTNAFIFAEDGNSEIVEDEYGDRLKEIPINDMIEIIEEELKRDPYRRYKPCLDLLKGFDVSQWRDLVVLHYGY